MDFQNNPRSGFDVASKRRCANARLYGIVEPVTGEYVLWEFSHLDSVCFEAFLDYFSQQYPDEMQVIQLDNS